MRARIADSVVVITGATSGIGRATALQVAGQRGAVVLAARQADALRELALECQERGGRALAVPTDVSDESQVQALAREAIQTFGHIDVWINDAAVTMLGRFEDCPVEAFRRVIDTNFFGYVHGARAVLPHFQERKRGTLINVASVVSRVGNPYATAYAASKAAVLAFSDSLRMELRHTPNIRVCSVLPATTDTPLFQHAANYAGRIVRAMPPVSAPEEVADTLVDLIVQPRREVKLGATGLMVALRTLTPGLAERLLAYQVEHEHFQDRQSGPTPGNVFTPMPEFNTVRGGWLENGQPARRLTAGGTGLALAAGLGALAYLMAARPASGQPRALPRTAARTVHRLRSNVPGRA